MSYALASSHGRGSGCRWAGSSSCVARLAAAAIVLPFLSHHLGLVCQSPTSWCATRGKKSDSRCSLIQWTNAKWYPRARNWRWTNSALIWQVHFSVNIISHWNNLLVDTLVFEVPMSRLNVCNEYTLTKSAELNGFIQSHFSFLN